MSISFNQIPGNLRVPFVAVEIDNSRATQGPALLNYRALLIGQKTSSGTATANTAVKVSSADAVATAAGRGSLLHRMAKAWFAENKFTDCYIGVLADNAAGVAATGTITVTGPATAAGTISLYIGGDLVQIAVASGDVQNTIATNIAAAITAATDLMVTASATTNVVTLTCRHKGTCGNDVDLRVNYRDGEATPAGVSLALVAMASGATNPVLTSLIAALGDNWYQVMVCPYTDSTSLTALNTETDSRFGSTRMIDAYAYSAKNDTYANLATLGNLYNNAHLTIVGTRGALRQAAETAASVAAVEALSRQADPARPTQTLACSWLLPPAEVDQFTFSERNLLLYDGISTLRYLVGATQIERVITTYKTNAAGGADESYLDAATMFTIMYLRYSFRQQILQKYPRHKLADDGTRAGPGQAILTPKGAKAEAVLWFRQMEELGLVENGDQFKRDVVVERDTLNRNRLNFLLPPDLVNQFIVGAVKLQFVL